MSRQTLNFKINPMICAIPRETAPGEVRAAGTPSSVARLMKLGLEVRVETGLGLGSGYPDASYAAAGAAVVLSREALLEAADVVLRVRKPDEADLDRMRPGALHMGFLDPFQNVHLIGAIASRGLSAIAMELIPRSTRAQAMDALTSQANLAGYAAVIWGAAHLRKVLPMMSTAAGTILPARVFVIGAGVAGLQAIATARRLGAKVEAFDTRPVAAEQVESLGAKFVRIDLGGTTGQTAQGYAQALTPEQEARQREGMIKLCAESDLIISTAQVFGKRAPVLITSEMLDAMKPGTVVVDLAVDTGGNVEGVILNQTIERKGVTILGQTHLANRVATHASQVYAMNLTALLADIWAAETRSLRLDPGHDILGSCLLVQDGKIRDARFAPSSG
ncbi:MAG: Re/Si-specific NAD(P)(+) transhydrogenase subunit alpha [Candidatus Methylacidiphilales bacterium]